MRVVYETQEVGLEVERAVEWWRANRDKAPDALEEDLAEAHRQLSEQGELIGVPVRGTRVEHVRRLHLRRVRFYLYFRVSDDRQTAFILSLWHVSRGTGPLL